MNTWYIVNKDEGFWSNEFGWTGFSEATLFSDYDKEAHAFIPAGGQWEKAEYRACPAMSSIGDMFVELREVCEAVANLMENPDEWPDDTFQAAVPAEAIRKAHAILRVLA